MVNLTLPARLRLQTTAASILLMFIAFGRSTELAMRIPPSEQCSPWRFCFPLFKSREIFSWNLKNSMWCLLLWSAYSTARVLWQTIPPSKEPFATGGLSSEVSLNAHKIIYMLGYKWIETKERFRFTLTVIFIGMAVTHINLLQVSLFHKGELFFNSDLTRRPREKASRSIIQSVSW